MTGKRILSYIGFFVLLICSSLPGLAQNGWLLDDCAFVCETGSSQVSERLNRGAQAFLLDLEEVDGECVVLHQGENSVSFHDVLTQVSLFLETDQHTIISLLLQGDFRREMVEEELSKRFSSRLFTRQGQECWPEIDSLKDHHIQVVAIFAENIASTSIEQIQQERKYANRFSADPLYKMVLFYSEASSASALLRDCYTTWNLTGKIPNFIVASSVEKKGLLNLVNSLNQTRRFKGMVHYKEDLLNEVYWNQYPGVITPAVFSFPLLGDEQIFFPYKNGYHVIPGEVIHNIGMDDVPRLLTAFDISMDEKLLHYFPFDNSAANQVEPEWTGTIVKDAVFITDTERGRVLHFSKQNSFVDYSKESALNFNTPISISLWVKPDSICNFMGIIGFGTSFSLKLKAGKPDFTTATIEDHVIDRVLEVNRWYHLAVIFNPNFTVEFFINGEKAGETFTSEINPTTHSLVIGNNVWGEQFYGAIDELRVWDRGLSSNEIVKLYHMKVRGDNSLSYWLGSLITLAIMIGFFIFRKTKRRKGADTDMAIGVNNVFQSERDLMLRDSICLFGNFCVISKENGEISPRFSPLLRQILSFLILSCEENKNGVSINKITDAFWPGAPKDKAKDNRGTNIKKIRKILNDIEGLNIVYKDKKWSVEKAPDLFVDICEYNRIRVIIEDQLDKGELDSHYIYELFDMLKNGNILQNIGVEWLDNFKSKLSNEVIDLLSRIYASLDKKNASGVSIKLARLMLLFDHLNEEALNILIHELVTAGKHGQAKNEYESFTKIYKELYGHPFHIEYQKMVENMAWKR
ncbi:MAG: hypothetical protein JEZ14_22275 [Marinilabiliaceae bacterium]|nr:hypothetical protein [Marinilabiliaceae bacterium]